MTNRGTEKIARMANADAYWRCQARFERPPRNRIASLSDGALKKINVRQKRLNTTIRCSHADESPPSRPAGAGAVDAAAGNSRRSAARRHPWIAPKTTN